MDTVSNCPLNSYLDPQISPVLRFHQSSFFVHWMVVNKETHSWSKDKWLPKNHSSTSTHGTSIPHSSPWRLGNRWKSVCVCVSGEMVRARVWRGLVRHHDFWTQQNLFTLEFTSAVITYTRSVQYQASQHSGMERDWGAVDYCWLLKKREPVLVFFFFVFYFFFNRSSP